MTTSASNDPPPGAREQRVLVVVMNNSRDWARVREQGWYRIPLKRAPKQVAADYLAFYHTAAFAEEKWSIRSYAAVQRYQLVTRAQLLPEEPAHPRAQELYFRVALGPLQLLPHPVPSARLRRITFIATTLERLLAAREINDLWPLPPSAETLWMALRAAGIEAERHYEVQEGRARYALDLALFCRRGPLAIECPVSDEARAALSRPWAELLRRRGWAVLQLTPQQLEDPPVCVALIRERIAAYGGLVLGPQDKGS